MHSGASAPWRSYGGCLTDPSYKGVIFDLGGVVLDSPLHVIARFEKERGIPANFVNQLVVETGPDGAWSKLERGEVDLEGFCTLFDAECEARGGWETRRGRACACRRTSWRF